jgi:uncharacterized protein involved in exopolysaccharide biosynthesis
MPKFPYALATSFLLTACVPLKRYQALEAQQTQLKTQLARERDELTQAQGFRITLESQLQARTRELAQTRQTHREQLAALTQQYNTLVSEHNVLADRYARLTTHYDSTQRLLQPEGTSVRTADSTRVNRAPVKRRGSARKRSRRRR